MTTPQIDILAAAAALPKDEPWTPEQVTIGMMAAAIEAAPRWAEQFMTLALMARNTAPVGQVNAWLDHVAQSFTVDYAALLEKMSAAMGLTIEQKEAFAQAIGNAMRPRIAELVSTMHPEAGHA